MLGFLLNPSVSQLTVLASGQADPLAVLLNYGGLGIGILLFVTGQLHSKSELEDIKEQRDKLMTINEDMRRQLMGQTVPTLGGMNDVLSAMKDAVDRQVITQKASDADLLRDVLAELRRGQRES